MKKLLVISCIAVLVTCVISSLPQNQNKVHAQESSPTPAPSKTPTPEPVSSTVTPSANIEPEAFQPKTQEDLSILTGNIQRPNGFTWFNGKLYTACTGDWTLYEIDTESGVTNQYIYGVRNAHSLYANQEADGFHLWVPDFQSNNVVHIYQGVSEVIASNLEGPWGIAPLKENTLAVTNLSGNNLIAVNDDGTTRELISGLRSPAGLTSDENYLYVANTGSARRAVEWFDINETIDRTEPLDSAEFDGQSLISGLQNTTNLVMGVDGFLYFSYALGTRGVVGRVDPEVCRANGGCTIEDVEIVLYTELAAPLAGLSLSPDMRLYVHSIFSPEIYWVQLDAET